MKNAWIMLILGIFFISCTSVQRPQKTTTEKPITEIILPDTKEELPSEGSKPIGPEYPVAGVKRVFTVNIETINYSEYSGATDNLEKASNIIRIIFNSQEYKEAILGHTFKGEKTFNWNEGLTNLQIYEKLFAGAESLMPAVNYQMDLKVKMYYSRFVKTVGYTYPSELIVYTNWKYHGSYDECRIASNLVHEWTHKMGFGHESKSTKDRPYTVPYAHNTIIEGLCDKARKGELTPL